MIWAMIPNSPSPQEDPSVLLAEYETASSTGFQHGVMDLMQRYVTHYMCDAIFCAH